MTNQAEAIQNLIKLTSQSPDTTEKAWLISAIDEWIRYPPAERPALEVCLGLNLVQPGKPTGATIIQNEKRDFHIREAVRDAQETLNFKQWKAAGYVAKKLNNLNQVSIEKRKPKDSVEYHLFQAVALDDDLPRSQSGILRIVRNPPLLTADP